HYDVVAGAEIVIEHVSRAKADLCRDASLPHIFCCERYDFGEIEYLALHIGRRRCKRNGIGAGAATQIEDAMDALCAKCLYYKRCAVLGIAVHPGDEVARPFRVDITIRRNPCAFADRFGQRAPAVPNISRVKKSVAVVVFGVLNEEASRLGSVPVIVAALRDETERYECVEKHADSAGIRVNPLPDLIHVRAFTYGCEDVEFERREEAAARNEAPDHLIQVLRQHALSLPGGHNSRELLAMLHRHGLHRWSIVPDKTSDGFASQQMLTDDFGDVQGLHTPVPYPIGVNDHDRAFIAKSHTAAGSHLHIVAETASPYLAIQRIDHCSRPLRRAGRGSIRLLLGADEEMNAERFHRGLRSLVPEAALSPSLPGCGA